MAIPVEWLVGPVAALAFALLVARELWSAHKEADARERQTGLEWRDRALALDARLDRIADAFQVLARKPPPK